MMGQIKCVLWNSSGLRASANSTPHKMGFFDKTFPNASFDVAAFVETHHKNEDDFPSLIHEYKVTHQVIHAPTPETHTHSGIILLIRKTFEVISSDIIMPGRILNVHIQQKIDKQTYNLTIYYGIRTEKATKLDMEEIGKIFMKMHQPTDNNLIMGDFNFIENSVDKPNGLGWGDKPMTAEWTKVKLHAQIIDPMRIQFPKKKYTHS